MTPPILLDDLIDALEAQSDSLFPFLDRETGEVVLVSDETLSFSEDEPEAIDLLPDWQKEEAELAVRIQSTDRYLALPSRFDVHEWSIMNEFCQQIKRDNIRARLLGVIQGNHAFRRFKDQLTNFDLWEEWNSFRRQAFGEIMREWCEENGIRLAAKERQSAGR